MMGALPPICHGSNHLKLQYFLLPINVADLFSHSNGICYKIFVLDVVFQWRI